jgi:hypothetical protein
MDDREWLERVEEALAREGLLAPAGGFTPAWREHLARVRGRVERALAVAVAAISPPLGPRSEGAVAEEIRARAALPDGCGVWLYLPHYRSDAERGNSFVRVELPGLHGAVSVPLPGELALRLWVATEAARLSGDYDHLWAVAQRY